MPKYEIRKQDGKEALFDENGNQISDWFDKIRADGLLNRKSEYFIAEKHKKERKIVRMHEEIKLSLLVKDEKKAIFHKSGKQISEWFDDILEEGLVKGQSNYFIAKKDRKKAIFDRNSKRITEWFDDITSNGLVEGQSEYFIAVKKNKEAIFDKSGKRISEWFDWIWSNGLVEGESDYYIAREGSILDDSAKEAIFDRNGKQVSEWFDWIHKAGLIKGESDYYPVQKDGKWAIFHKSGEQVSEWFDKILEYGLVNGESNFFFAKKNGQWAVFHKSGRKLFKVEEEEINDKDKVGKIFEKAQEFYLEKYILKFKKRKVKIALDEEDVDTSAFKPKRRFKLKP